MGFSSFGIGRAFGIPVRIHWSMLLFLAVVLLQGGGLAGVMLMVAVFASVVIHEIGHALVARSYGMPIVDISLYPFGGMARLARPPRTTTQEIVVALAGPITSLVLAGLCAATAMMARSGLFATLARLNLVLGVFNLVPALPMDGGRVFRALLARRVGFYRATVVAARVARWLALALGVFGVFHSVWFVLIAVFLFMMSYGEEVSARIREYMGDPGYHDAPGRARRMHPLERFFESAGFAVPGSDWEILDPDYERPHYRHRRVWRKPDGSVVVVEWQDGE